MRGALVGFGPPELVDPFKYDSPFGRKSCLISAILFTIFLLPFLFLVPRWVRSLDQNVYGLPVIALLVLIPLWVFTILRLFSPILPKQLQDFNKIEEWHFE
jgi:hypothetical protein